MHSRTIAQSSLERGIALWPAVANFSVADPKNVPRDFARIVLTNMCELGLHRNGGPLVRVAKNTVYPEVVDEAISIVTVSASQPEFRIFLPAVGAIGRRSRDASWRMSSLLEDANEQTAIRKDRMRTQLTAVLDAIKACDFAYEDGVAPRPGEPPKRMDSDWWEVLVLACDMGEFLGQKMMEREEDYAAKKKTGKGKNAKKLGKPADIMFDFNQARGGPTRRSFSSMRDAYQVPYFRDHNTCNPPQKFVTNLPYDQLLRNISEEEDEDEDGDDPIRYLHSPGLAS